MLTTHRLSALERKAAQRLQNAKTPEQIEFAYVEVAADELYALASSANVQGASDAEKQIVEDLHVGALNSNSRPGHKVTIRADQLALLVRLSPPAKPEPVAQPDPPAAPASVTPDDPADQ